MKVSTARAIAGISVVSIGALAAASALTWIGGSEPPATAARGRERAPSAQAPESAAFDAKLPIPVEGVAVVRDTLVLSVSAAGEATSFRTTPLRSSVTGTVRAVRARENASAGTGDLLVELEPADYELSLREARGNLARAEAAYRELVVFDDRIADASVRAERERNARAKTGLEAAESAVERAELNLTRTRVRAPFPGRVANIRVVPGQYVTAGEELMTVQQMDPLRVDVQVLESEIGLLAPGRRALLSFAAFPNEILQGVVETINPIVDRQTRTARVAVSVRNAEGRLLPGMYARVSLAARKLPDRILVPRTAVLDRDHRTLVFVVEGDGVTGLAKWRYVTTGLQNATHIEIVDAPETERVEPGEIVLTAGHFTLTHDARVRLTRDAVLEGGRPQ
jgi:HlyD family secretion protein